MSDTVIWILQPTCLLLKNDRKVLTPKITGRIALPVHFDARLEDEH